MKNDHVGVVHPLHRVWVQGVFQTTVTALRVRFGRELAPTRTMGKRGSNLLKESGCGAVVDQEVVVLTMERVLALVAVEVGAHLAHAT